MQTLLKAIVVRMDLLQFGVPPTILQVDVVE